MIAAVRYGLRQWTLCAFAVVAATLAEPGPASGQSEATVRVGLPVTEAVGVLELPTGTVDFGSLSFDDVSLGWAERAGPVLAARANHAFSVFVSAPDPFSGPVGKSVDDLRISTDALPWTPLSATNLTLVSTSSGGNVAVPTHYRWLVSFVSDPPGSYTLEVFYRLAGG